MGLGGGNGPADNFKLLLFLGKHAKASIILLCV